MICYFSGTGNSRWAARRLAERLGERLVNMADEVGHECHYVLGDEEKVGLVFPVHGWRTPKLVRRFIDKLTIDMPSPPPYSYIILTAGDSIGNAMERLLPHLQSKGLYPQLFGSLIMPESYVGLPGMDVDKEEKERQKVGAAKEELDRLAGMIAAGDGSQREQTFKCLIRGPLPKFFSSVVGGIFERYLITDKPFRVETERCVECGACVGACPVGNMAGGLGNKPQWLHHEDCLCCFSCYHHCPTHAIEYGARTRHKGQYYFGRRK